MAVLLITSSTHILRAKYMESLHYYTALIAMINSLNDQGLEKAYALMHGIFLRYSTPGNEAREEYNEKMNQLKDLLNV